MGEEKKNPPAKLMNGKTLTPEFQAKMLRLAILDKDYASMVINAIGRRKVFDTMYDLVWNVMMNYYTEYKEMPDWAALVQLVKTHSNTDEQQHMILAVRRMTKFDKETRDFVIDHTEMFIRQGIMAAAVVEAVELLQSGHPEKIEARVRKAVADSNFNLDLGHDYEENYESRCDYRSELRQGPISSGFAFDCYLGFGLPDGLRPGLCRGEVGIMIAGPGRGKSTFLVNTAANAYVTGHNVLFVTLELNERTVGRRMDMRLTGLPNPTPTQVRQRLHAIKAISNGRMIIKYFPPRKMSLTDLNNYLDQLKMTRDFIPDMVIVDYLGLVKPMREFKEQKYLEAEEVVQELRGLGTERKFVAWTAHQTHRGSRNKERVDAEDIAGSYGIMNPCDILLSLSATQEQIGSNRANLNIVKNRVGKCGVTFPIRLMLDRATMVDTDCESDDQEEGDSVMSQDEIAASFTTTTEKAKNKSVNH